MNIYGIYRIPPKGKQIDKNDPLYYNSQHTHRKELMQRIKRNILKCQKLKEDQDDEI